LHLNIRRLFAMKDLFGKLVRTLNISGRDFKIFIFSLLLAFGIWLIHNLSLNYTEVVEIPVQAVCEISGHSRISSNSAEVRCRCKTSGFSLISIGRVKDPVQVDFDPADMHPKGNETYFVTNADLERYTSRILGGRAKVESYVSDTLMFVFPQENHKKVPVQPEYSMSFASQYINTGGLVLVPDSVIVYGEPYHLNTIDRVFTEPVVLKNLKSSAQGEVRLNRIKGVRLSDEYVKYSVNVSRYVEIHSTVPVYSRNVPKGKSLIVYPSAAKVTFKCAFPVSSDPTESVRIYVDYNDFQNSLDGQCLPHSEKIPDGVFDIRIEPEIFDCVESGR
jgi:hypothetical protein